LIVPAKPFIESIPFHYRHTEDYVPPWSDVIFFQSGREAIIAALDKLKVPRGSSIVLPALICNSVPEILVRYGFNPLFVDSATESPFPQQKKILQTIHENDDVRAVLVVNYFGFFDNDCCQLNAVLRQVGCVLIEDRCHSSLSSRQESHGCQADAIIYSIRKSLISSDGGALWLRSQRKRKVELPIMHWYRDILFSLSRFAERVVCELGWPNIYSKSITKLRKNNTLTLLSQDECIPVPVRSTAPSWFLSLQLKNKKLLDSVIEYRCNNYLHLEESIRRCGLTPLFNQLDAGVVPQVLPVLDVIGGLVEYLRENGVGAYRWPGEEMPGFVLESSRSFHNAIRLNQEVVCLPVHQSIRNRHIYHMINLIEKWL
jgi:dTDP-4-amino-4,6-dideoxygalactose transaminase